MYADDVVLISPSAGALQCLLNVCDKFSDKADLVYNCEKTVCMCISQGRFRYSLPEFFLKDRKIRIVEETKYLGHIICSDFSDDRDIDRQIRSVYCRSNLLIRRFSKCNDYVKCSLFKSFCSSLYCCSLWLRFKKAKLKRLFVSYNNAIRKFLCLPMRCSASLMYTLCNIQSPQCVIRNMSYSLFKRVQNSERVLLRDIYRSSVIRRESYIFHCISLVT